MNCWTWSFFFGGWEQCEYKHVFFFILSLFFFLEKTKQLTAMVFIFKHRHRRFILNLWLGIAEKNPTTFTIPHTWRNQSSNEKRAPCWLFYIRGWNPTQVYGDYFINHEIRIPFLTNQDSIERLNRWCAKQPHQVTENFLPEGPVTIGITSGAWLGGAWLGVLGGGKKIPINCKDDPIFEELFGDEKGDNRCFCYFIQNFVWRVHIPKFRR